KAPGCRVGDLAPAVRSRFGVDPTFEVIGTRHAEKLSEALASSEELARAEDLGNYFRIPADDRDLNYSLYVEQGDVAQQQFADYDSHTVERLTVDEVEGLLLPLPEVRAELAAAGRPTER